MFHLDLIMTNPHRGQLQSWPGLRNLQKTGLGEWLQETREPWLGKAALRPGRLVAGWGCCASVTWGWVPEGEAMGTWEAALVLWRPPRSRTQGGNTPAGS